MEIIISCSPDPRGRFVSILGDVKQISNWRRRGQIKKCSTKTSITTLHNKRSLHHRLMIHKGDFPLNSAQWGKDCTQLVWWKRSIRHIFAKEPVIQSPQLWSHSQPQCTPCNFICSISWGGTFWLQTSEAECCSERGRGNPKGKALVLPWVPLTKHFLTPMFHTSSHLIIPWDTASAKPLHSACLDKCK